MECVLPELRIRLLSVRFVTGAQRAKLTNKNCWSAFCTYAGISPIDSCANTVYCFLPLTALLIPFDILGWRNAGDELADSV